jgi:hypothetical protein
MQGCLERGQALSAQPHKPYGDFLTPHLLMRLQGLILEQAYCSLPCIVTECFSHVGLAMPPKFELNLR